MKMLKFAFLGCFLAVTGLMATTTPIPQEYLLLHSSEMKFLRSLDAIQAEQPDQMDLFFLAAFELKYEEWKELFLDEVQEDLGLWKGETDNSKVSFTVNIPMADQEPPDGDD